MPISSFFVHESSYADDGCVIGEGTKVWHFCHIMPGAVIGEKCSIGQNVNIGSRAILGNNCKIQNNVSIYDDVELEDDVFCGPSMVFTNVINPRSFVERKHEYKKTLLKKGATIGANATIECGNTIGRYAMVGAGAVITHDIPDYALVFGSPARIKGWICECGVKLVFHGESAKCAECGAEYKLSEEVCTKLHIH
jgi:UDP-2-acetamido-3-amino-2,3-dideoxy-glucuronate N-acetyltransferase